MKTLKRIAAVLLAGIASILLIQWMVRKLHRRFRGGDYISLYDEDWTEHSPHPHLSAVQRRFLD